MADDRTVKQKILDLLNRAGVDIDLDDFAYLVYDVAHLLADDIQRREPNAFNSIALLREGGDTIQRHLGWL